MGDSIVSNGAKRLEVDENYPKDLFKRMADMDKKQNEKLSKKVASSSGSLAKGTTKTRFLICTLGLLSLTLSQMSRMVINVNITKMVPQKEKETVSSDGSCPWPVESEPHATTTIDWPEVPVETTTMKTTTTTTTSTTNAPPVTTATTEAMFTGTVTSELYSDPTTTTTKQSFDATTTLQSTTQSLFDIKTEATPTDKFPNEYEPTSTMPMGFDSEPTVYYRESTEPETEYYTTTHRSYNIESTTTSTRRSTTKSTRFLRSTYDSFSDYVTEPYYQKYEPFTDGESQSSLNGTNVENAAEERFDWDMNKQTILLGGFYYSYFVFMILGGRMAEIYGAKYVLMLSVAGSAIINLTTPWMARTSFTLLVFSRVVMGAIQAGVFPGMYALFAKWLTMSEASIFAPLIKVNLRLGMMIGTLIPGIVPAWPGVFYVTGGVCAIWSVVWFFLATSDPKDCNRVSASELAHITKKKRKPVEEPQQQDVELADYKNGQMVVEKEKTSKSTPWMKIITSRSVIGLIIVKLTFNYSLDFLAILLPTYLNYVHHLSTKKISSITTPFYLIQVTLVVFVGWLAKHAVKTKPFGLSKTGVRKAFQALASYGMGLFLILLTFNGCNLTYLVVILYIISFLSMFTAGGETMLPYDLSDEYPATIMAIANSIANLSGVTTTKLAGIFLEKHQGSYERWNVLINFIGGANLIGGLAFSILVKAEPIDFDGGTKQQVKEEKSFESVSLDDVVVVPKAPKPEVGYVPKAPKPEVSYIPSATTKDSDIPTKINEANDSSSKGDEPMTRNDKPTQDKDESSVIGTDNKDKSVEEVEEDNDVRDVEIQDEKDKGTQ